MRILKIILPVLACAFTYTSASSQNALINIITHNSGIVKKGETVFLEVTINNTDPSGYIGIYKIKTQINVPKEIAQIDTAGHVLPTGWTITSNNGSTMVLSNGKNMIASNDSRTLLIAIRGMKIGGPSTISGQLSFSNGEAPGTAPGVLAGDNLADNSSTTTIKVQ